MALRQGDCRGDTRQQPGRLRRALPLSSRLCLAQRLGAFGIDWKRAEGNERTDVALGVPALGCRHCGGLRSEARGLSRRLTARAGGGNGSEAGTPSRGNVILYCRAPLMWAACLLQH